MKKIGTYTVRGQVDHNVEERITLFDGKFNTGFVVKEFFLYPNDGIGAGNDAQGLIYTETGAASSGLDWNWGSNEQIGWAYGANSGTTSSLAEGNGMIDPDNLIIEDLYIRASHSAGAGNMTGYMIVMEKYEFTDWQGALGMVRNRSQA